MSFKRRASCTRWALLPLNRPADANIGDAAARAAMMAIMANFFIVEVVWKVENDVVLFLASYFAILVHLITR